MKAAVVTDFNEAPRVKDFPAPSATNGAVLINVLEAGVYPRVRSQANGAHYTSTGKLPMIPGLDGVGTTQDGQLVYFSAADETYGALAEQTVTTLRRVIELPNDVNPTTVAGAMNPAMSSWLALRTRVDSVAGKRVLILGATGAAGKLAVQISKYLGAKRVVGVGRNRDELASLAALGADETICLLDDPAVVKAGLVAQAEADIVLDYLWGDVAKQAMLTMLPARQDHSRLLTWVEIGSMSGQEMMLPSAALRSVNLRLIGSGQGSIGGENFAKELPVLATLISEGTPTLASEALPLMALTAANWNDQSHRYVYTMN